MIKTRRQIYLDKEDVKALKAEGRRTARSMSQLIRVAIKEYIRRKKNKGSWKEDGLTAVVGTCLCPDKGISEHHDKFLYGKK